MSLGTLDNPLHNVFFPAPVVFLGTLSLLGEVKEHLSRLVGNSTMWFRNRSDTNRPVQS